ncbi:hypothetical protein [Leucobacter iarius]|uniref:WXG100 family type VII secretion target n=1 Tax=Leucobacter iarius TaxID=333963 RepID=A0ABN2L5T6_9MICO
MSSASAPPIGVDTVLVPPSTPSLVEQTKQRVASQSGSLLGQIDAVVGLLIGFSPLEEWVYKPFIGDWNAMEVAGEAWPKCGQAVQLINERVSTLGSFVDDGWQGKAAYSFGECHAKLGQLLERLPQQCEQAGEMDKHLAEFARKILDFINEVISGIVGFGLEILSMLAVPVVGEINLAAVLEIAIPIVAGWAIEIVDLFNEFLGFLDAVIAIHTGMVGLLGGVRDALTTLTSLASVGLAIYDVGSSVKGAVGDINKIGGAGEHAPGGGHAPGGRAPRMPRIPV